MRNGKYVYDNTLTEEALKSYLKYSDTRGKGSDNNTFGGLYFELYGSFPLQGEIYNGQDIVGYFHLRHGELFVDYPYLGFPSCYFKIINDDDWQAEFYSEEERQHYLTEIAGVLNKEIKYTNQNKSKWEKTQNEGWKYYCKLLNREAFFFKNHPDVAKKRVDGFRDLFKEEPDFSVNTLINEYLENKETRTVEYQKAFFNRIKRETINKTDEEIENYLKKLEKEVKYSIDWDDVFVRLLWIFGCKRTLDILGTGFVRYKMVSSVKPSKISGEDRIFSLIPTRKLKEEYVALRKQITSVCIE